MPAKQGPIPSQSSHKQKISSFLLLTGVFVSSQKALLLSSDVTSSHISVTLPVAPKPGTDTCLLSAFLIVNPPFLLELDRPLQFPREMLLFLPKVEFNLPFLGVFPFLVAHVAGILCLLVYEFFEDRDSSLSFVYV